VIVDGEKRTTEEAISFWLLVHPDGRVKWKSIDFREDRPQTLTWFTKWRWQRWVMSVDPTDNPFLRVEQHGGIMIVHNMVLALIAPAMMLVFGLVMAMPFRDIWLPMFLAYGVSATLNFLFDYIHHAPN
jgi:hypothetical protein